MKQTILLLLTIFLIGCSNDNEDADTQKEYVGKWHFIKATSYTNGNLSNSLNYVGTCEGKSYFDTKSDGKIDYDEYTNQYVSNNNYQCQLKKSTGFYDENKKKIIMNDGYEYKDGSVSFIGSQMNVTAETAVTINGTTTTVKSILTLQK